VVFHHAARFISVERLRTAYLDRGLSVFTPLYGQVMSRLVAMKTLLTWLLVPVLTLALGAIPSSSDAADAAKPVTVFVLRHAEADSSDPANRNPGLADAGSERAIVLSKLLSKAGVTHIFTSEYQRTEDTVQPLAELMQLESKVVSARSPDKQLSEIESLPAGSIVVIAGHSNTTPGLVAGLGVELSGIEVHPEHGPMLGHDEYDRLFVVTLPRSDEVAPSVIELRYGN
jgi:2,3-bisphosphoglycerate-dependent phosphoglycerate mutase